MVRATLNFDWIEPDLAVGGAFPMEALPELAQRWRIGAVVDLREEACDEAELLGRHGVEFLHLPTPDRAGVALPDLVRGVAFVEAASGRGVRTLIHCQEGIGRSATLALCVLVARGKAPLHALGCAKDARACISPSPEQFEAWTAWLDAHRAERAASWTLPDFDSFGRIAYRHLAQGAFSEEVDAGSPKENATSEKSAGEGA